MLNLFLLHGCIPSLLALQVAEKDKNKSNIAIIVIGKNEDYLYQILKESNNFFKIFKVNKNYYNYVKLLIIFLYYRLIKTNNIFIGHIGLNIFKSIYLIFNAKILDDGNSSIIINDIGNLFYNRHNKGIYKIFNLRKKMHLLTFFTLKSKKCDSRFEPHC